MADMQPKDLNEQLTLDDSDILLLQNGLTNEVMKVSIPTLAARANLKAGYQLIADQQLAVAGDTITVSGLAAYNYLHLEIVLAATAGNIIGNIRFNNDVSANYAYTNSTNGAADGSATSATSLLLAVDDAATMRFCILDIINIQNQEKLCFGHTMSTGAAGATNAPLRRELNGKWANITQQINRIDAFNVSGGDLSTISRLLVYGHK